MVKLRKRSGPYNLRLAGCESEFGLCECEALSNRLNPLWSNHACDAKTSHCTSDMTLRHTLCAPEPAFGRGSFFLSIGTMCK